MKARLELNPNYIQALMSLQTFRNKFDMKLEDGLISELWLEDKVVNNDEATFRVQCLDLVKTHFCQTYNESRDVVDIGYKYYGDKIFATYLIRKNSSLNPVATILTVKA